MNIPGAIVQHRVAAVVGHAAWLATGTRTSAAKDTDSAGTIILARMDSSLLLARVTEQQDDTMFVPPGGCNDAMRHGLDGGGAVMH
jgi:hypothetical protein